jgi:uncharacterized protein YjbI with pentapeptide repeats
MSGVVVPRACRRGSAAKIKIDQLITPLLRGQTKGLFVLLAPPGGGKTTALAYLRAVLPPEARVQLFDEDERRAARTAASDGVALLAASTIGPSLRPADVFELCAWTIEDCLEYLAGKHRAQCASVLERLTSDPTLDALKGSPQLLTLIMDRMAEDPLSRHSREILRQFTWLLIPPGPVHDLLMADGPVQFGEPSCLNATQQRWWRHDAVERVFAAEWIADQLCRGNTPVALLNMTAAKLLPDIVAAVRLRPAAIAQLEHIVRDDPQGPNVAMAASILLKLDPDWRPPSARWLNFAGANLRGVRWSGINLDSAFLAGADLSEADLSGAILAGARAGNVRMLRANLRGARLHAAVLTGALLTGADLTSVFASGVDLRSCDASGANFADALLDHARMDDVNLSGTRLNHCSLTEATLRRCTLDEADFSDANLDRAMLWELAMQDSTWTNATFRAAQLVRCNLEGLELPNAHFEQCGLRHCLLTGTRIPGGHFNGASLCNAGVAEIDWPDADLRDADFTHASFHLGSSRSGLVGSTIPCEGSRTGFYTDEYNEQDYKSPEEIRKACLCGADLRGARIEGTDFYLVDLRAAQYTQEQARHFGACGAILVSRAE